MVGKITETELPPNTSEWNQCNTLQRGIFLLGSGSPLLAEKGGHIGGALPT